MKYEMPEIEVEVFNIGEIMTESEDNGYETERG